MKIQVLFFGAVSDAIGERQLEISFQDGTATKAVIDQIKERFPKTKGHKLLFAVNQSYANGNEILIDGDELAIFTAVSGG